MNGMHPGHGNIFAILETDTIGIDKMISLPCREPSSRDDENGPGGLIAVLREFREKRPPYPLAQVNNRAESVYV
jgi:hypothetical protein